VVFDRDSPWSNRVLFSLNLLVRLCPDQPAWLGMRLKAAQ